MPRTRHTTEEIRNNPREAEVIVATSTTVAGAASRIGVSEQTFYCRRAGYGALRADQAGASNVAVKVYSGERVLNCGAQVTLGIAMKRQRTRRLGRRIAGPTHDGCEGDMRTQFIHPGTPVVSVAPLPSRGLGGRRGR